MLACISTGVLANLAARPVLDPLVLLQEKASQTTTRRAIVPTPGCETASLALG